MTKFFASCYQIVPYEVMLQSGLASSVVIQRREGTIHSKLQNGDKSGDKETQQTVSNTSTDKAQNKRADIRQGTDEKLGRYTTQILLNPLSTHIDLLGLPFQRPH